VPFEYEAKITELQQTLNELDEKLSGITKQQDVVADDDELDVAETAETKSEKAKREEIYSAEDGDYQPVPNSPDDDDDEPGTPRRGRSA
jgi:hypothetical protein